MVERADKFEVGYIEVRGWWLNVSHVLVNVQLADSIRLFNPFCH